MRCPVKSQLQVLTEGSQESLEPGTPITVRKSQAGKGHSGSQEEGREVTTTRTTTHSSMPDAVWLPRGERELETDWLTPLGSSFF